MYYPRSWRTPLYLRLPLSLLLSPLPEVDAMFLRLDILNGPIINCDPRVTRGFPEAFYQFVVSRLEQAGKVSGTDLLDLRNYLAGQAGFDEAARQAGIDPAALLKAVEALRIVERLVLLDAAEQRPFGQNPA